MHIAPQFIFGNGGIVLQPPACQREKRTGIKFGQRLVGDLGWVAQAVFGKMVEIVEQELYDILWKTRVISPPRLALSMRE